MPKKKVTKDLMVDINDYPHIPYWFSINQAIKFVKVSLLSSKKCPDPMAVLVFDEKYNLMGTLSLKDLVKAEVTAKDEKESKKMQERPVSEIMIPVKFSVETNDSISRAASVMIQNDLILLPVLKNKKFVGLVRMIEIFQELSDAVNE